MDKETVGLINRRLGIVRDEVEKALAKNEFSPTDIANITLIGVKLCLEPRPSGVFCRVEIDGVLNNIADRIRRCDYPTEK